MITLSYGYGKPQNPDTGDLFFPALEADIQQLNDHTHDGLTSAPLASTAQSVLSGGWASAVSGPGPYRQLLTVPPGLSYDTCEVWVKRSTGERAYPSLVRVSSTTFYIYTCDKTLAYTVFYR